MTRVKHYSIDTGQTVEVRTFNLTDPAEELKLAHQYMLTLSGCDHGTDDVYFLSEG